MDLAIVIVSWNVRDLLAACLRSLFDDLARSGIGAKVWVVDNASADGSPQMVTEEFPSVRLIASDENLGFAAGNNLALCELGIANHEKPNSQSATRNPPYIWLLNPDTEVRPGAATALISALKAHPSVGVAGAKLLYGDGSLQHGAFRFPGLLQLFFELFPLPARLYETQLNGRYAQHLFDGMTPFPIDHPLGASMMVRGEAVAEVGLMDEKYHMYCEEIDWCWRMRRAGWGALCVPTAEVIHHAGQSTAQTPIPSFLNLWTSRARLYARYHGPTTWRIAQVILRAGMRRKMRNASPEMVAACRQVIQMWETAGGTAR